MSFPLRYPPMGSDRVPMALIMMADAGLMFGSRLLSRWFSNGCVVC